MQAPFRIQISIARSLISFATIIYGFVPIFNFSHVAVFNPSWPPYARLQGFWLIASAILIAILSIYLLWRQAPNHIGRIRIAGFLGICILAGYFLAIVAATYYSGSLNPLASFSDGRIEPDGFFFAGKDILYALSGICLVVGIIMLQRVDSEG